MDPNIFTFIFQEQLQCLRRAGAQLVREGFSPPDIEQRFFDLNGYRIDVPSDPIEKWAQYLFYSGSGYLDGWPVENGPGPSNARGR